MKRWRTKVFVEGYVNTGIVEAETAADAEEKAVSKMGKIIGDKEVVDSGYATEVKGNE